METRSLSAQTTYAHLKKKKTLITYTVFVVGLSLLQMVDQKKKQQELLV